MESFSIEYPLIARYMREQADKERQEPLTDDQHINRLLSMKMYGAAEAAIREMYERV